MNSIKKYNKISKNKLNNKKKLTFQVNVKHLCTKLHLS